MISEGIWSCYSSTRLKAGANIQWYFKMEHVFFILVHNDGGIDDDKFLILHYANRRRNLHGGLPYYRYERFHFEQLFDDDCEVGFRFKMQDIDRLASRYCYVPKWSVG